ncbi:tRNA-2-methylthio-N6-dimethylallyladenosine synthase [Anaerospora hongkongensis]|uniref:tRNA-2-methylthio-N(6)-dimethylallyladenosine synthase n=1 Tax=Anaerospora hongkongensis TaxID=244830 RepID=A0A4R1PXM6_9FIRM|nr:tRNA (N6-isopentenyl adenosine(37)-C2)-methylthiotransferase MiaB [Anaerospora hongkongensis]TCL35911.1 tRNA-2-methylthio-N6-dimethylallyladenosine synthase [Anaerospora hongkongensis]
MSNHIKVFSGPTDKKTDTVADLGKEKYFFTYTFGCQMNENDSERLAGQLRSTGYQHTDNMEQADVILINTCCVRESAEKKIYGKIGELKRLKTLNPNLVIGIAGCMAQKDRDKLFKKAPHIDIVMGTHNTHQLIELLQEVEQSRDKVLAVWDQAERLAPEVPTIRKNQISAWVPIMYGCNNFCTYCIVPYVRGRERSRPLQDIVQEIEQLGKEGFKEITLLGQNVNSYGKDSEENVDFADLLQAVDKIQSIARIRYMTSHPRDMSDKVIQTIAQSSKICKHFHLPIQSGSNAILQRMNRGYTVEYYIELVKKIRDLVPDASITTDLIIGFPGETDELFAETLEFIKEIQFDAAYTFLYSIRSGTPAASMDEQIQLPVKKARLQQLMDIQNEISLAINRKSEGQIVEVMVEGPSKNDASRWMGRTGTNKIVIWDKGEECIGDLKMIKIMQAQTWLFKGQMV